VTLAGAQTVGGCSFRRWGASPRRGAIHPEGPRVRHPPASATRVERVAVRSGRCACSRSTARSNQCRPSAPSLPRVAENGHAVLGERARRFLRLPHEAGHEFFFDLGAADQRMCCSRCHRASAAIGFACLHRTTLPTSSRPHRGSAGRVVVAARRADARGSPALLAYAETKRAG